RRASFAAALGPNRLFESFPQLKMVEYEPIHYPPLARQTRTSGEVKIHFSVDTSGAVTNARIASGHSLLVQIALTSVRSRKFVPIQDGPVEFEVNFDFVMRDETSERAQEEVSFDSPSRIRVL